MAEFGPVAGVRVSWRGRVRRCHVILRLAFPTRFCERSLPTTNGASSYPRHVVTRVRPSGKIRNPVEFSATWGDWDSFRQVETSENGIKEAAVGKLAPKQTVEPGKNLTTC